MQNKIRCKKIANKKSPNKIANQNQINSNKKLAPACKLIFYLSV